MSGLSGPPELLPLMFRPLPLGAIKPQGWLKDQLILQANGLSGHLPLFWADVMNSSWIGGKADGGLHERGPYWLNGFLPLAYQLENQELIDMAFKYVDYIINNQTDGWLGPDDDHSGNQYWSKYQMMMILRHVCIEERERERERNQSDNYAHTIDFQCVLVHNIICIIILLYTLK